MGRELGQWSIEITIAASSHAYWTVTVFVHLPLVWLHDAFCLLVNNYCVTILLPGICSPWLPFFSSWSQSGVTALAAAAAAAAASQEAFPTFRVSPGFWQVTGSLSCFHPRLNLGSIWKLHTCVIYFITFNSVLYLVLIVLLWLVIYSCILSAFIFVDLLE